MDRDHIGINLTVEEGQTVFQALSELPFKYVYELIGKINQIANGTSPKKPEDQEGAPFYEYPLLPREIELMIQALGQMPYQSVHTLITRLDHAMKTGEQVSQ
jgi:hypothetical protein